MKKQPSKISLWWQALPLQRRLYLAFTLLFIFCAAFMGFFLLNAVRLLTFNQDANFILQINQQVYALQELTQQYELSINNYEVSGTDDAWAEISTNQLLIVDLAEKLGQQLLPEDLLSLEAYLENFDATILLVEQIVEAVDDEDWDAVVDLDFQVYESLEPMIEAIQTIVAGNEELLESIKLEIENYTWLSVAGLVLMLPLFLLLAGLAAWVVYQQINHPFNLMTKAAHDFTKGDYQPALLAPIAERDDEVGRMAREFLTMADASASRSAELAAEAQEIRTRIK